MYNDFEKQKEEKVFVCNNFFGNFNANQLYGDFKYRSK